MRGGAIRNVVCLGNFVKRQLKFLCDKNKKHLIRNVLYCLSLRSFLVQITVLLLPFNLMNALRYQWDTARLRPVSVLISQQWDLAMDHSCALFTERFGRYEGHYYVKIRHQLGCYSDELVYIHFML